MARTKDKTLTLEEKLEQALVPVEEQPYEVPENWCWCHIADVLHLQAGKNISAKNISPQQDQAHPYPCFGGNGIRGYVASYNHDGDYPIIGRQGALCGNLNWASGQFYATEHAVVTTCSVAVFNRWAYFILGYMNLNQYATATAQPGLAVGNVEQLPLALCSLPEQHRIVDRIERLFAELDEAEERAQAVIDSYEGRRASILHRAFTGELTEEWRQSHPDSSVQDVTIASVCRSLKYGTAKKSKASGEIVVLRMGNLQNGEIDWTDLAYSDDAEDNEKYKLFPGDVLFNRTNSAEKVGKTSIYRGEHAAIYAGYIIKLDYDHSILTGDYLNYMLNTPETKEYCNQVKTDGVNQSNINAKKIGAFIIPLRGMAEQAEIVRILDSLLTKESAAKAAAERAIAQIDTMKKSILARAFRGELGTNDPEDEPAINLLKRTLTNPEV